MATEPWYLRGDYFENCNCDLLCPCVLSPDRSVRPDQGHCDVAYAFHIDEGRYGASQLDGLNTVVAAYTPGPMGNPDWKLAVYVDERATPFQREVLTQIFSGKAGGPPQRFTAVVKDFLGVKAVPIHYKKEGKIRSVHIPQILDFQVEALTGRDPDRESKLVDIRHFVSTELVIAKGIGSRYEDYGMKWDNTGKTGQCATFDWVGP
ncbi:MAG: DUF1326 domain-containing protein [Candidatus Tectomicrobia bacterium]|nr:DUF1326 domain-containing protein [Candidatus Tectomicrobia bacterium]